MAILPEIGTDVARKALLPNAMKKPNALATLGATLRRIRLEKELTQEEVAERAEVHVNYVSMAEHGLRNVGVVNLLYFARALDVHPCELLADLKMDDVRLPKKNPRRLRSGR